MKKFVIILVITSSLGSVSALHASAGASAAGEYTKSAATPAASGKLEKIAVEIAILEESKDIAQSGYSKYLKKLYAASDLSLHQNAIFDKYLDLCINGEALSLVAFTLLDAADIEAQKKALARQPLSMLNNLVDPLRSNILKLLYTQAPAFIRTFIDLYNKIPRDNANDAMNNIAALKELKHLVKENFFFQKQNLMESTTKPAGGPAIPDESESATAAAPASK